MKSLKYLFINMMLIIGCGSSQTESYIDYTFNDGWGGIYSVIINENHYYIYKRENLIESYYMGILNSMEINEINKLTNNISTSSFKDTIFSSPRIDQAAFIIRIKNKKEELRYYSYGYDNTPNSLIELDSLLFDIAKRNTLENNKIDTVIKFNSNGEGILWP